MDHAPAERSVFLNQVCGNDAALREEVETLLIADAETENFLTQPAYEFAAGMLADEPSEFSAGQEVGQYEIECFLSSGGMGQIYEAHDTKLGRKIALKFISPEYAKDPHRVKRFEQEARAASALNHPNVCVIHDVGVTDNGRHFIAMEFIVGSTLRDELARRTFTTLEAFEITIQVGNALASAHAKGIVHRDIKPENIMLRHDGFVKVVDFGLAKLTELIPEQQHIGTAETKLHTEPHMIMGTVKYMSPEQLREAPVDERTDIWSLGVVLYEMLTGVTPFDARAPNDSIALILASQPQFNEGIPIQLREIIEKTLEKDCTQRYQTITKLTADLRKLKWELEHNKESYTIPDPELQLEPVFQRPAILTRLKSQAVLTADSLMGEIRTHKTATLFAGATSVLILLLLFFLRPSLEPLTPTPPPSTLNLTMKRVTDAGTSVYAALSPDGKWIAYAERQNEKQRLVITSTTTPPYEFVAVPEDDVNYVGIVFSHNSNELYFTRREKDGDSILYRFMWRPGGANPIKLKQGVNSPISFSPQGDRFAFVRLDKETAEYSLILSNIDGTNEQVVASRKDGATLSVHGVAWSDDGSRVFCPAGSWENGWHMNLIQFDPENGREQLIGNRSWFSIQQVAWQQGWNSLVISATGRQTTPHQLWRISFPEGDAQPIITDLSEFNGVSLSDEKILTVLTDRSWRLWVTALDGDREVTAIATGAGRNYGLDWTSKGKIVFSAMALDNTLNIYQINPDGSNKIQLTSDAGDNYMPASSRDGESIVFASNRNGPPNIWNIWSMNANGSNATQLTRGTADFYPSVSPDNQWVAYDNLVNSKATVWKVSLGGGEPMKVGERYRMPVFSPDNQFIAARYDNEAGTHDVAIFPAQGGQPLKYFNVPVQEWQSVKWLSSQQVSYVKNVGGYSNIWTYDLETGAEKQITHFNSDQIYAYAWSPDHKHIACLRGSKINNVTMISNSSER